MTKRENAGIVLISTMFMIVVLTALLASYSLISRLELATTKSSRDSVTGFYTAEAGLNLRAEDIRSTFIGYNVPTGVSPSSSAPCEGSNIGSGDFVCTTYDLAGHDSVTYIEEEPGNPVILTIPQGELYQGLNAQEYRYTVTALGKNVADQTEAVLELRFKSRLVPLFQFAAFYDKDLEILPGPAMTLSGPVHTNGDLYLETGATLQIAGQVTSASKIYRGRKNDASCLANPVQMLNPTSYLSLLPAATVRTLVTSAHVAPYNGMVQFGVQELTVPDPGVLSPSSSAIYYNKADLRLALRVNSSDVPVTTYAGTGVEVRNLDGSVDTAKTTTLNACAGSISGRAIGNTATFKNNRETPAAASTERVRMLEVDMQALLNCLHSSSWFGTGKALNESSEGGLVFHFSVDGPNASTNSNVLGVRIRNATNLRSSVAGAPTPRGITVATDQALYTVGNYNSTNKIPAALLADSYNVLSANWFNGTGDTKSTNSTVSAATRPATATTVNAAVMAGTDTTGNVEGTGGQSLGIYNGGLENYPRFHEYWSGITFTYRGSFVSLGTPQHQNGAWVYGNPQYTAPNRNWNYDTSFNNAANLPPLTPRFVYLRQELFVRRFEQ